MGTRDLVSSSIGIVASGAADAGLSDDLGWTWPYSW